MAPADALPAAQEPGTPERNARWNFRWATLCRALFGYLMEISPDDRRPQYSGYMNVLVAPSRVLPLLAGVFISVSSFEVLFTLAALAVLARLAILAGLEPQAPAVLAPPRGVGKQPPS